MRHFLAALFVAILANTNVAEAAAPVTETEFFNGKDLTGWSSPDAKYFSVQDGVIIGQADEKIPHNVFLWSKVPVKDFYLHLDVRLTPKERNAGIQFRSKPHGEFEAQGYQADVGAGWWGKLYHESGRGMLDASERGNQAVKPGEWNRYEILAVGHKLWAAINGQLAFALEEPAGELSGQIALQIHSGPPQKVEYRLHKLVHNPKVELAGMKADELHAKLIRKQ